MTKIWRDREYTEMEEEAIDWLKNTDTMQFSKMELLTMFTEHWIVKYSLVDVSKCLCSKEESFTHKDGSKQCGNCWKMLKD